MQGSENIPDLEKQAQRPEMRLSLVRDRTKVGEWCPLSGSNKCMIRSCLCLHVDILLCCELWGA